MGVRFRVRVPRAKGEPCTSPGIYPRCHGAAREACSCAKSGRPKQSKAQCRGNEVYLGTNTLARHLTADDGQ